MSYSHTGLPVAVFANGAGAENFNSYYDNTEKIIRLYLGKDNVLIGLPKGSLWIKAHGSFFYVEMIQFRNETMLDRVWIPK